MFTRTTRSLVITEVGQRFLPNARRILTDLDMAEKDAVGEAATPHGHLTITSPVTFGRLILAPQICSFLNQYPLVTVSVLMLDRVVSLVDEGIDVAVRVGSLPDSSLAAKRIGSVRRMLVASPDYIARRGTPASPSELKQHAIIAFTGLMPNREWRFRKGRGPQSVALDPIIEINDAQAAIDAAEFGHGITPALSYMVHDKVRAGTLVEVLDTCAPPPQPVHLVYPQARLVASKIRAFVDFSAPRLKQRIDRIG